MGVIDTFKNIYRVEGIAAFWKGTFALSLKKAAAIFATVVLA
jgi:hypothetical protein